MGREAKCVAHFGGQSGSGKALLETSEILFRGPFRVVIPLKAITSIDVRAETLDVAFGSERVVFELGAAEAAKWVRAVREPKSVLAKLGVKTGQRVRIIGLDDPAFRAHVERNGAVWADAELDHLFLVVESAVDLARIVELKPALKAKGALWLLRPKGRRDLTEVQTRTAGRAAGLVDVKVVGFSETLSAEKYVIPASARRASR
jgi:hypothetical protein